MRINLDCVRDVLNYLADHLVICTDSNQKKTFDHVTVDELCKKLTQYSSDDIWYSVYNLCQCNYIEGTPDINLKDKMDRIAIANITFEGHQFIDSIREPTRWETIKTVLKQVGNYSLNFVASTAQAVCTNLASQLISQL